MLKSFKIIFYFHQTLCLSDGFKKIIIETISMLSDRSIKDYISRGLLKVTPTPKIGPASIDLHIGNQLYRSNPQAHLSYQEEVEKLDKQGKFLEFLEKQEEPDLPFDRYVSRFGIPVADIDSNWILEPNHIYYAQTAETITAQKDVYIWIATRSSCARNGLRIQYSEEKLDKNERFKGKPFLVLQTYGTRVELPKKYPVCQMIVGRSRNLMNKEIEEVMKKGDIDVSGSPVIEFDSVILTFHPKLMRHNGKTLNPAKDSSECFDEIDITNGFVLEPGKFYLGSTQEVVSVGTKYVGILDEFFGLYINKDASIFNKLFGPLYITPNKPYLFSSRYIHLNAPYHWPGSDHQMTLEIFPTTQERIKIKAGDPACRLLIQELYPECEFPYNSRYNGQEGPTINRTATKS